MSKTPLIFFGSGPVGLASLNYLFEHFEIEAIVTKPNPKSSRAPRLVAAWAQENNLPLYQPEGKAALSEMFNNLKKSSRLGVVIDYGYIINQDVISSFELGILNSHFSLLPQWRGADPITFSLLSGQSETGVSLMKIVPALDEGDLIAQETYSISQDETIYTLTENLVELSNHILLKNLAEYIAGNITPYPQSSEVEATYSRKLSKNDGQIDWRKSTEILAREVRAYLGWPGSYTTVNDIQFTILKASVSSEKGKAGTAFISGKKLGIYCADGAIIIERIRPSGKKEMDSASFLNGYNII